jgi:hypothetical protein
LSTFSDLIFLPKSEIKMEKHALNPDANDNTIDQEVERIEVREATATVDPAVVRSLKRKADLIIIPTLAVTYLFKYVGALTKLLLLS